jgi:hypothetical protein
MSVGCPILAGGPVGYSSSKAANGSTLRAPRAGRYVAKAAAVPNTSGTASRVAGGAVPVQTHETALKKMVVALESEGTHSAAAL